MRRLQKVLKVMLFLFLTYPCGVLIGLLTVFLKGIGRIRVEHSERLPKMQRRMIISANHPSEIEPVFLSALFFGEYVLHPFTMSPYSTPDEKNWKVWYLFPLWSRFIFIPRGNRRGELTAIRKLRTILQIGWRAIVFAEGGRTHKGVHFLYSSSGKHRIRPLKSGLAYVASSVGAVVVPVWVEVTASEKGFFHWLMSGTLLLRIGVPIEVEKHADKKLITESVEKSLLALADEGELS